MTIVTMSITDVTGTENNVNTEARGLEKSKQIILFLTFKPIKQFPECYIPYYFPSRIMDKKSACYKVNPSYQHQTMC